MKVKKSEIQLLIAVLGVLLVVVTYFLVYAKFNELSDSMESQNMSLRSQVSTLEVLEQRKADYLAATEKMKTYITGFENRFPADILPEDSIMMVKNMEDATRTYVANISFGTIGEVAYDAQASADNSALAAATAGGYRSSGSRCRSVGHRYDHGYYIPCLHRGNHLCGDSYV